MGFSDLSKYMRLWNAVLESEDLQNQIKLLLDGQQLIFYFKKGEDLYGAGEDGRVTFAKMKNPDDEGSDWQKEATFVGVNLKRALEGIKIHNIFGFKDLKEIKVLDREDMEKMLVGVAKGKKNVDTGKLEPKPTPDPNQAKGMQQLQGDEDE